jgi:hypothetical protein
VGPRQNKDFLTEAVVLPGFASSVPLPDRVFECQDSYGRKYVLTFINHLPCPCDANSELGRYPFLDSSDFEDFTGVPFRKFWAVWVALNRLLMETFPILWPEYYFNVAAPEVFQALLEQMDDYCETALGSGVPASILESSHQILARQGGDLCPDKADCAAVIEFLTCRKFDRDCRFVEQPFVFYPVNDRFVIWDYYRHGGLLRCLARELTRRPSNKSRAKKGTLYEDYIKAAVSAVPGVTAVRKWVLRKQGRNVWDVDVGFVYREILFLIEAKNEQKNERYYFDPVQVADRVTKRENLLQRIDSNLGDHKESVRCAWKDCERLAGAICVVCTEEAEFIATVKPGFWLELNDIPRICLISELLDFLNRPEAFQRVSHHPAFVHFD